MGGEGAEGPAVDRAIVAALLDELGAERTQEICGAFVQDGHAKLAALQAALDGDDAALVARAAHGLKSGSGFVGAKAVFQLCADMERTAGTGDLDFSRRHLDDLRDRLAQAEAELVPRHG